MTGRTHQIRLHLQLIGFPIANDPCYGGEMHYGEPKATADESKSAVETQDIPEADCATPQQPDESNVEFMKRTCRWCKVGPAKAFNETQLHCARIWLHALQYEVESLYKIKIWLCIDDYILTWIYVSRWLVISLRFQNLLGHVKTSCVRH